MKNFQDKKIWQKIVIILLLILLFKFAINTVPVYAESDDGVLLEPITGLFANLGDGIMEIMQKTFLGVESSGAWVEENSGIWAKILLIAAAIFIATVAIAATIISGGGALAIAIGITSAVIKIGVGTAIAYFVVDTIKFGSKGFYLPEYELTLQSIFSNEILAFDVNFFNPDDPVEIEGNNTIKISMGSDWKDSKGKTVRKLDQSAWEEFKKMYDAEGVFSNHTEEHKNLNKHDRRLLFVWKWYHGDISRNTFSSYA